MAHIKVVDGGVVSGATRLELRALADFGYEVMRLEGMFELDRGGWMERCEGASLLVCLSPTVERLYGERIRRFFAAYGAASSVRYLTLRTTEAHKTMESALAVCEAAKEARLDRHGILVAIGGGIVLDVVGFAASMYRRGIRYVKVPTTLVGQVDVAVGLKTGVNALGGKNLLGTYYPAHLTINDPQFLRTLPAREVRCGLAEILKMGLVCDAEIFTALEAMRPSAMGQVEPAPELVHRAMLRMMEELQPNLFETNLERLVDFGHTFSMRIETASQYAYAHGEAVAIDMALSSCIAHQLGLLSAADVGRVFALLARCGLRAFDAEVCTFAEAWEALLDAQLHRGNRINLVVPAQIGRGVFVRRLDQLPAAVLERALAQAVSLSPAVEAGKAAHAPRDRPTPAS